MPAQFTTTLIPPNTRGFEHILEGGSSADVVAKVVLNAVTTENPSLRHLAGKDAET